MSRATDVITGSRAFRASVAGGRSIGQRLRRWVPGSSSLPARTPPPVQVVVDEQAVRFAEHVASLEVAVDALDDRLSREVVEREAKLLEEIRVGMRSLEQELSDSFAEAVLAMRRSVRRGVALLAAVVVAMAGLVAGGFALL